MSDNFEKQTLEVAIATDSNYIVPVTVMLKSLFENNKDMLITINILYLFSLTKDSDIEFLDNYITEHGNLCRRLGITDEQLGEVPECRNSKNTYLRLLLPSILPTNIHHILYMDGDIIINKSIEFFCSFDLGNAYIAGAKETTRFFSDSHCKELNLPDNFDYFNAGIVLMNIKKMREEQFTTIFFDYIRNYFNVIYNDQDILNGTLWENVKYFPPKFNMNFLVEPDAALSTWDKEELDEAKKNPVIVHYIGPMKPWDYLSYHPKTQLWWKYLKLTPFADFKPQNKSLSNFFKKHYLLTVKTIRYRTSVKLKRKIGKFIPKRIKEVLKNHL